LRIDMHLRTHSALLPSDMASGLPAKNNAGGVDAELSKSAMPVGAHS